MSSWSPQAWPRSKSKDRNEQTYFPGLRSIRKGILSWRKFEPKYISWIHKIRDSEASWFRAKNVSIFMWFAKDLEKTVQRMKLLIPMTIIQKWFGAKLPRCPFSSLLCIIPQHKGRIIHQVAQQLYVKTPQPSFIIELSIKNSWNSILTVHE